MLAAVIAMGLPIVPDADPEVRALRAMVVELTRVKRWPALAQARYIHPAAALALDGAALPAITVVVPTVSRLMEDVRNRC